MTAAPAHQADIRAYEVHARSTDVFGRVLCSARDQHLVIDGPVQNGCPGEALTPAEAFLAGVAACGVELVQVLARQADVPLRSVQAEVSGRIDRSRRSHPTYALFDSVAVHFALGGVTQAEGERLVESFKGT